jgi:hypothetical protein
VTAIDPSGARRWSGVAADAEEALVVLTPDVAGMDAGTTERPTARDAALFAGMVRDLRRLRAGGLLDDDALDAELDRIRAEVLEPAGVREEDLLAPPGP